MKFLLFSLLPVVLTLVPHNLSGKDLTDYINSKQSLWKAEIPKDFSYDQFQRRLMKPHFGAPNADEDVKISPEPNAAGIPATFDARQRWAKCVSIGKINDQSDCESSWAFAAAEAASDRFCIATNGDVNTFLSAEDVLSCCTSCGHGCAGGYAIEAWRWFVKSGFCTGSSYEANLGCKPYSLEPCSKTVNNVTWPNCPEFGYDTPHCVLQCTNSNYSINYKDDKHFASSAYAVGKKATHIQEEILANGPVESVFTIYEDFYQYKSGVYVHVSGMAIGSHGVRILGWGVDNGTPYWLVANSWNVNWGEQGYFRVLRGVNECGLEHAVVAGMPKM